MPLHRTMPFGRSATIVVVTLAIAAGCTNELPVDAGGPLHASIPSGAVQAAIQQLPLSSDGSVTFVVRVLAKDVDLSSFQGTVTFSPGAATLVSAGSPQGADGETHVLNTADFTDGRIRFAAFTPTTFVGADAGDGVEAFRFTVKGAGVSTLPNMVATLEFVGKETGVALAANQVLASPGVQDLAGRVLR